MVGWSITVVLKTTVPRGTGGSNPSLSALSMRSPLVSAGFFLFIKLGSVGGILSSTLKKAQCHLENR